MQHAASAINAQTHTQVINLDRSPERFEVISAELETNGITFDRFSAFDGRALDLDNDPVVTELFDLEMWQRRHHRNPIPADIGCYLSHFHSIRTFLEQDKPLGMIFEDDATLVDDFAAQIAPVIADHENWDILKLHARHPGALVTRKNYSNGTRLCSFITKHAGATCYVINKAAGAKMLNHMTPAVKMNDWVYDEGHKMKLRVRTLSPMPVSLQPVASTIEVDRDKSKRSWIEKHTDKPLAPRWSLPFRRIGDNLHRVSYNLFADGGLSALMSGKS